MLRIKFQQGVWTACLGLAGGGAVILWPTQTLIGCGLLVAAAMLAIWGITIDGKHWWKRRPVRSGNMLLSSAFRHLGHGSQWSITECQGQPANWKAEAEKDLREKLRRGDLIAWATLENQSERRLAPDPIEAGEWSTISFPLPIENFTDRALDFVMPLARTGLYRHVLLDAAAVYRIWPKWSFCTVLRRKFTDAPKSFAERTGEFATWAEHDHD